MPTNDKFCPYQSVTDRIVAALEAGPGEWAAPWQRLALSGMPRNGATGRAYSGINIPLLALGSGYSDCRWMTYKQASAKGAQVRKGEKASTVTFWKMLTKPTESGKVQTIPMLRVYSVFNAQQMDGIETAEPIPDIDPGERYTLAAKVLKDSGAHLRLGGDRACFIPSEDLIRLPKPGQFKNVESYWGTTLHELIHWTGHHSRLNRLTATRFGSDAYAMEELVAELGSAFLCARLGIAAELQHAEYMNSWIKVLKSDKRAIFAVAKAAQTASEYLYPTPSVESEEEE